jgi:hypothetical protein
MRLHCLDVCLATEHTNYKRRITMNRLRLPVSRAALALVCLFVLALPTAAQTPDGWVVLPVTEYAALKRAAAPAEPEPVAPPVEATLSHIDYELKVDGDLATGEARLTVDVIKNGWVRVAMPDGLIVRGAMELKATESGGLRRMDVREASAITRSLSHLPLQAAFRYTIAQPTRRG